MSQKFCGPKLSGAAKILHPPGLLGATEILHPARPTGAAEILRPQIDWCHRNSAASNRLVPQKFCGPKSSGAAEILHPPGLLGATETLHPARPTGAAEILRPQIDWCRRNSAASN